MHAFEVSTNELLWSFMTFCQLHLYEHVRVEIFYVGIVRCKNQGVILFDLIIEGCGSCY